MLFGVFWTALLTLLTPVLTTVGGFGAMFTIRLLEGIGEVGLSQMCCENVLRYIVYSRLCTTALLHFRHFLLYFVFLII